MRQDINELRRLAIGLTEMVARIERNQREVKDDLEVMFKTEIVGFRANIETALDARFERLEQLLREGRSFKPAVINQAPERPGGGQLTPRQR